MWHVILVPPPFTLIIYHTWYLKGPRAQGNDSWVFVDGPLVFQPPDLWLGIPVGLTMEESHLTGGQILILGANPYNGGRAGVIYWKQIGVSNWK